MDKRAYKLQEFVAHASDVKCLNIGKKSCRVFVTGGEDRKVHLWAIGKPTSLLSLSGHTSPVESVTLDSAEGLILAGASNGVVKLWDLEEGKIVRTLTGHRSKCTSLEFHPFGEFFASGSLDADLKIWDIRKKGCIHTYKGHTRGIRTIRFTPDGRWVVSGGEDNIVKVWDLTAGKLLHDFKYHSGVIQSIDFHPHEFLLATGSADRTVKFWDLETFELIGSAGPEDTGLRSMIFHPDGKTLFCGLNETLKVFSWEPVRCHDDVSIGWSMLGDISIYEGKLLGCSYHQSSVGVWVVDISLIGPYATDGMSRSNSLMDHVFKSKGNLQKENSVRSLPMSLNGLGNQGGDVKEIIHTECVTSNIIREKPFGKVDSAKASKATSRISAVNKGNLSWNMTQKIEDNSASKSSMSMRDSRAKEISSSTPVTSESSMVSKGSLLKSSRFSGSGSLIMKKDTLLEMQRGTDILAANRKVHLPVVPTGAQNLQTSINSRKDNFTSEIHMEGASHGDSVPMGQLKPTKSFDSLDEVVESNFLHGFKASAQITDADAKDGKNVRPAAEKFERVVFLDRSFGSYKEKSSETHSSGSEISSVQLLQHAKGGSETHSSGLDRSSVKYIKGVAIQHGRTRSLVESWERRDTFNNSCTADNSLSIDTASQIDDLSLNQEAQSSGRGLGSEDDDGFPGVLVQSHDLFINALKSRLMKLQMVRHCWQQNGIKGTITAIAKLPDHSVQVDVISILVEKVDLYNLDLFLFSLPLLLGLLGSSTERHTDISMEMLLKLVRIFGPVIRSTMSARLPVGIDVEAEKRRDLCRQCFKLMEKIKDMLPPLIRRGGLIARRAMELNLALQI